MIILSKGTVILDHYKIEELKTAAGQCFGYNAIDIKAPSSKPWERSVFVKQYHDIMPGSDESHSLLRKYDALRDRLGEKSNYICLPQSSGEAGGALVTVFPFVNGKSLKDKFMDGLTQEECIRISFALIKTVREIHKKGIAHLDLKHDNVVIEESARDGQLYIRLIDFDAASIDGTCLRSSVKGTEHYFSPEHAFPERFGEVSSASDIFTLGIMLSELLLRRHPFAEAHDYRAAITSEDYQIPENEYHREVVEKILQCLSADPMERPTAGSLLWTFNKNYETGLMSSDEASRWQARRCYVQLTGVGENSMFLRTYFSSTDIDHNELRGASIKTPQGVLFRLKINKCFPPVLLPNDGVEIKLDGRKLQASRPARLSTTGSLAIGRNGEFLVLVADY